MGMDCESVSKIFSIQNGEDFNMEANRVFLFQFEHNPVYRQWCSLLGVDGLNELAIHQKPFLPISFFKTHRIASTLFEAATIFESSGTTQTINSKHFVKDIELYRTSFVKAFELFYGDIKDWCIIGLLPSYLERKGSSLIMMVDEMIKISGHEKSGFYLNEHEKLASTLLELERHEQKTLLIGVTFGLLDFAEQHKLQLNHTTIMETGGMKGRRKEMTRQEVHDMLKKSFSVENIHSEYGMTELLSQAYSKGNGRFACPPWVKILVRDEEDPLLVKEHGKGILNIIDLANAYSCSFIATDDVGIVHPDGSFEVQGRLDSSDIRGCSLLVM
jgi:hypothetical protein